MDRRMRNFMILLLWHIMILLSWVCAKNMHNHLATSQGLLDQGNELKSPRIPFFKQKEGIGRNRGKEADEEVLSRLGSRPPRCEHRCRGCAPCVPIQVPTTAGGHGVVTPKSYTNYEPEGWKCKCGSILFNP